MLAMRRESTRSTYIPHWQRMNLDVMVLVVALIGFAVTFYLSNAGILNTYQYLLLLPPLTLFQSVCFILPIQVIIPSSLVIVLGILMMMCFIATGTTTRIISIPSTSQTLRLNQD